MADFDMRKFLSTGKRSQITPLSFTNKPRKVIEPETIETLAAEGLNKGQIGKRLGISDSYARERINETLTMTNAYKRGREQYKQKLKTI